MIFLNSNWWPSHVGGVQWRTWTLAGTRLKLVIMGCRSSNCKDAALQTARDGIALLWLSTCPRETNLPINYLELEVLEGIPTFNGMTRCLDHKVYILERKISRNYQTLIGHCGWPGCFLHLNHSVQGYLVLGRMVEDHTESNLSLRSWNPSSRKPCPSRWIRSASRTRAESLHNTGLPGRYVPFIHP